MSKLVLANLILKAIRNRSKCHLKTTIQSKNEALFTSHQIQFVSSSAPISLLNTAFIHSLPLFAIIDNDEDDNCLWIGQTKLLNVGKLWGKTHRIFNDFHHFVNKRELNQWFQFFGWIWNGLSGGLPELKRDFWQHWKLTAKDYAQRG